MHTTAYFCLDRISTVTSTATSDTSIAVIVADELPPQVSDSQVSESSLPQAQVSVIAELHLVQSKDCSLTYDLSTSASVLAR